MGEPGNGNVSGTRSLFADDLKQYQESHKVLKVGISPSKKIVLFA